MNSPPRVAITVSLLLAAIVHASALSMAGGWPAPALPLLPPAKAAPGRATLVLLPAPAPRAGPPTAAAAVVPTLPTLSAVPSLPDVPPTQPNPAPTTVRAAIVAPTDDAPQAVRFYTYVEVDRAATPESDWSIDIDTLDTIGITRLVFEVMVSDRGDILACTVLDPLGLDDTTRLKLEQQLADTRMQPALRGGRFVASLRRIELLVESPR